MIGDRVKVVSSVLHDGTATVTGLYEKFVGCNNSGLKPGKYTDRESVVLTHDDGRTEPVGVDRCRLADSELAARRESEERAWLEQNPGLDLRERDRVGDLPEEFFWEGDSVRVVGDRFPSLGSGTFRIVRAVYDGLPQWLPEGCKKYPFYSLEGEDESRFFPQDCLSLAEKGTVRLFYGGGYVFFPNIWEQAKFYDRIGHAWRIRNPKDGTYEWTVEGVRTAIRNGIAHGYEQAKGDVGPACAVRFRDESFGKWVAYNTLIGVSYAIIVF